MCDLSRQIRETLKLKFYRVDNVYDQEALEKLWYSNETIEEIVRFLSYDLRPPTFKAADKRVL